MEWAILLAARSVVSSAALVAESEVLCRVLRVVWEMASARLDREICSAELAMLSEA